MTRPTQTLTDQANRRARALAAVDKMEEMLSEGHGGFPSMVQTLWEMFNDPTVDAKQRVAIANTFLRITAAKEIALAEKGLSKRGPKTVEHHQHLTLVFNKTEAEIAAMEPAARELYLGLALDAVAKGRAT